MIRKNKNTIDKIIQAMVKDRRIRLNIVKRSIKFFFYFYFTNYTEFPIAPFHEEMFHIAEDTDIKTAVVAGFRGCGKSVLMSLVLPLWVILGEQKIKYVLITSKTEQKAQMLLQQIKQELEDNELLRQDLGPFREERGQWNTVSLYLDRYKAKITIASSEQSIRSFRHMQHRPQLIICDDLEDLESVKTKESREKLYNWLMSDVIPAGSRNTRLIVLGGIFHENSLLNRLQKSIGENKMNGVFLKIPFFDENGNPSWSDKYPDEKTIEDEKKKIGDERIWLREYMLRIVGDVDQVIDPENIHYYDELLSTEEHYNFTVTGVDPAFSVKDGADYTAMVSGRIYTHKGERYIYILPYPVNERLKEPDMIDRILMVRDSAFLNMSVIIVEDVGAQKMIIQILESKGVTTVGFHPGGSKKIERLALTADKIKSGHILFPRTGAEHLINQIVNFDMENHDDLADAFTTLVLGLNSYHPAYIGF